MMIIDISGTDVGRLIEYLQGAQRQVLVTVDPTDRAFKVKVDGGIWSPPMGQAVRS